MSSAKRIAQLVLLGFLLAAPMAAQAQEQSPAQAACHPVNDPNEDPTINEHTMAGTHAGVMLWQSVKNKGCAFYDKLNKLLTRDAEAEVPKYDTLPEAQKKNWLQKLLTPSEVIAAEEPETNSKAMLENEAAVQKEMWDHDLNNPEYRRRLVNHGEKVMPDGGVYDGEMKNGQPDGVGVEIHPNGEVQRGVFNKDGNQQGLGEALFTSGGAAAGLIVDGGLLSGAEQDRNGTVQAGIDTPDGHPIGLIEVDQPNGEKHYDYKDKNGSAVAIGPVVQGDADPLPPAEPAGFPPEPARDVPIWSPTTPIGSVMAEEMRWDPDARLDWAALSPEDGTDPLGNARFCRPLTGTLTSLQQQQCNEDRREVTAKLKSKDPIGERMFCQPLTGYMPPDLMEACGIKPEPPPAQTARPAPAPTPTPQQPQPRVAVVAPPSSGLIPGTKPWADAMTPGYLAYCAAENQAQLRETDSKLHFDLDFTVGATRQSIESRLASYKQEAPNNPGHPGFYAALICQFQYALNNWH